MRAENARLRTYIEKPRTASRGETWDFIQYLLGLETKECVLWPFGQSHGRGRVWRRDSRKADDAHAVVCELAHGPRPFPEAEAAHSCGVKLCANKAHLSWKTTSQNQMDRVAHGTSNRGEKHGNSRITEAQAWRAKYGGGSDAEAAREIGCSRENVSHIRAGRSWAWL